MMNRSDPFKTFIIAEAGVNHDGSVERAVALIDAASDAGADAVKFQTFRADALAVERAPKAAYQTRAGARGESQRDMLRRLELSQADHRTLAARCEARGIGILSSPFDVESLAFLTDGLGLETIKIGSGEITNGPLLLETARRARRIILSTGMSTLQEIAAALDVIACGIAGAEAPNAITEAVPGPRRDLADRVTLLHCTSAYPAPIAEVNLHAMATLAHHFALPIGYSDHTKGNTIAVAAVACGARVLEKHLTLDCRAAGPDHSASSEPAEFAALVRAVRDVERAMGDGVKRCTEAERDARAVARKSLIAARRISAGEVFNSENLAVRRPGTGISPMQYWTWIGRKAARDFDAEELIEQ